MTVSTAPLCLVADKGPAQRPTTLHLPPAHSIPGVVQLLVPPRVQLPAFTELLQEVT